MDRFPLSEAGDPDGDLLIIGWGSTKGAIEEAVTRVRKDGFSKTMASTLPRRVPVKPSGSVFMRRARSMSA